VSFRDFASYLVASITHDTTVFAERFARLYRAHRLLPIANAAPAHFWAAVDACRQANQLTATQDTALNQWKNVINGAFGQGYSAYLVLNDNLTAVKELLFVKSTMLNANQVTITKGLSNVWSNRAQDFVPK
jgi:hypothetical protein